MKAKKLFALIAALLCLSMLFVACSKEEPEETPAPPAAEEPEEIVFGLADIMNLNYEPKNVSTVKATELSVIGSPISRSGNLVLTQEKINDNSNPNGEPYYSNSNNDVFRIYNMDTVEVVWTGTNAYEASNGSTPAKYTTHNVDFINGDYFAVLTEVRSGSEYGTADTEAFGTIRYAYDYATNTTVTNTLSIYDVSTKSAVVTVGSNTIKQLLKTYKFDNYYYGKTAAYSVSYLGDLDLVVKDNSVYREDKDGKLTLVKSYDLDKIPNIFTKKGDYYYGSYSFNGEEDYSIGIYDKELNRIASYEIPTYAADVNTLELLNNGDIFVQYSVLLDDDETSYDYIEENYYAGSPTKYDLVTVIVKASDGTVTNLKNVNYIVTKIISTKSDNEDKQYYNAEKLDNIAKVLYIKDNKWIDYSDENYSLIAMANDGSIVAPIELGKDIKSIPIPLGGGMFSVTNVHGVRHILNSKGEIVTNVTAAYGSKYFHTEKAIYDVNGTVVYDLKANDATLTNLGNAYLIESYKGDIATVYLFADGKTTQIGVLNGADKSIDRYGVLGNTYYTYSSKTEKYTYFNTAGEQLVSSKLSLSHYYTGEEYTIYSTSEYNSTTDSYNYTFYKFAHTK